MLKVNSNKIRSSSPFFLSQRVGLWQWRTLLKSAVVAVVVLGASMGAVLVFVFGVQELLNVEWAREAFTYLNDEGDAVVTSPPATLVVLCTVGISFWGAAIAGSLVHRRPPGSLIAPFQRFRWSLVGKVLALEILLQLLLATLHALSTSGVTFTGVGVEHLIWVVPLTAATLLQTTGEDVFFKGYLLRQLGALTRVAWLAPIMVTSVFLLGHVGNSDLKRNTLLLLAVFAVSELLIMFFVLRTGGMEVPFVLHWTNNMLIFLFLAEAGTQANDLTLWVSQPPADEAASAVADLASSGRYLGYMMVLSLGLLWSRSPFYVGSPPVNSD